MCPPTPDPEAKPSVKILQRFTVEPTRQVVIDDDGTERIVVGRRPRGY
jgi:hypothetical protein